MSFAASSEFTVVSRGVKMIFLEACGYWGILFCNVPDNFENKKIVVFVPADDKKNSANAIKSYAEEFLSKLFWSVKKRNKEGDTVSVQLQLAGDGQWKWRYRLNFADGYDEQCSLAVFESSNEAALEGMQMAKKIISELID